MPRTSQILSSTVFDSVLSSAIMLNMAFRDKFDVNAYWMPWWKGSTSILSLDAAFFFKPRHACAVKPEVPKSWTLEIDYARAPCLGADQTILGLWERNWYEYACMKAHRAKPKTNIDYFKVLWDGCPLGHGTAYVNLFLLYKHAFLNVKKLRESNPGNGEHLCTKESVDDVEWVWYWYVVKYKLYVIF